MGLCLIFWEIQIFQSHGEIYVMPKLDMHQKIQGCPPTIYKSPILSDFLSSKADWLEQGPGGTKFHQRDDQLLGGPSPEIMTMILLLTFCWRLQRYPEQTNVSREKSKVTEDSGNFFWWQKLGGFLWKNEPGSFTPRQSNCKKRGDFFTWRHRSDPESTSFCRGFYHDPTNSSLIFPLRFFFASDHVFWPPF